MTDDGTAVDREDLAKVLYDESADLALTKLGAQAMANAVIDSGALLDAAAVRHEAQAEVANAFVAWAAKNEIAEPPLHWKRFDEIARRYGGGDDI